MADRPVNRDRPDARTTVLVLTVGTLIAVALFAVAFVLRLVGQAAASDVLSTTAVIGLLVTPALALLTTSLELRRVQRAAAVLAVVVLVILVVATLIALAVAR